MTADADLVSMLGREELVRKVTQVYTLERLAVQDVATALPLLAALAQVTQSDLVAKKFLEDTTWVQGPSWRVPSAHKELPGESDLGAKTFADIFTWLRGPS